MPEHLLGSAPHAAAAAHLDPARIEQPAHPRLQPHSPRSEKPPAQRAHEQVSLRKYVTAFEPWLFAKRTTSCAPQPWPFRSCPNQTKTHLVLVKRKPRLISYPA